MRHLHLLFFYFITVGSFLFAQPAVVINELDCDTPGIDDKEFIELKSATPNFRLDGYVVVFYNGSASGGNTSYLALDLDGYATDINGILLMGSTTVVPFPQYIIANNLIQNGADAVAIYKDDAENFTEGTLAYVDESLIDVLLYDTNDADAEGMLAIFRAFNPQIQQINEGNANNTASIQRKNGGTYFAGVPTPRLLNDGSGVVLNGVLITIPQTIYNEGESFELVFTTEQNVEEDLAINFSLSNGTFNVNDFAGSTLLKIVKGQNKVSTTISVIDDISDEGDEIMKIYLGTLPPEFLALNNNVEIRIVDNDFKVAAFGTPANPTYDKVTGTFSIDYYSGLSGKSGAGLHGAVQNIVADPVKVRAQTYNDVIDILKEADQNPANSNQVWLVYLEKGRPKLDFQLSSDNFNTWNREHTWPRSRGGFNSIEADEIPDGKNIYWVTNADSTRHANSDAHGIRAEDGPENSSRGNQFYGEYNGPAGTLGSFKGDVARSIFFLDVRYNGLEVVNGFPDGQVGKFGDLATLLEWHRNDLPDDFEKNRNNVVYTWQNNRNPFIDMPDLVEYIWGNKAGDIWQNPSHTSDDELPNYRIYPNPINQSLHIEGLGDDAILEMYTMSGVLVKGKQTIFDDKLDILLPSGTYVLKIQDRGKIFSKKVVIE
jgi:Endonuclease I/Secretion system C-terminal sorting domain